MKMFKRFRAALRLKEAVRQADDAHKKTGERYYVMPNGNSGKLIIMDRYNFRKLKHKGYLSRKAFVRNLEMECFYCTPYRNGSGKLPRNVIDLKRKQYISWVMSLGKTKRTSIFDWLKSIKGNGKQV